jgi:hypothetical protein
LSDFSIAAITRTESQLVVTVALISVAAMNPAAFAEHMRARDHIALERLDMAKNYKTLLANADKHAFYRAHIAACGRIFKWNLLSDPRAAALRTALYGEASAIDNGYSSDGDHY